MDNKKGPFRHLYNVMDTHFRSLHSDSIGTNPTSSGILNLGLTLEKRGGGCQKPYSITAILHAVFYYCGLNFCSRGGDEHRSVYSTGEG